MTDSTPSDTMHALVYTGNGRVAWQEHPRPTLRYPTDAIVRITTTTICGTDLHIVRGHVPTVGAGRVLGHEGIGIVESVGTGVVDIRVGDRVVVGIISACGHCVACRRQMPSHCAHGGWQLGNSADGTQAEFVRVPFADNGLFVLPPNVSDEAAIFLSCALPTAWECGVQSAQIDAGDQVVIVGAGPVGLATLLTAKLRSPVDVVVVDVSEHRLDVARRLGATHVVNSAQVNAADRIHELTNGRGADVAIEAVGLPETFALCQTVLAPGGRLANMGVHHAPVQLDLGQLWSANMTLTTRLIGGTSMPRLAKLVASGQLDTAPLISHRFLLPEFVVAYETFERAGEHHAVKVVVGVR